jgi:hypothetical protein
VLESVTSALGSALDGLALRLATIADNRERQHPGHHAKRVVFEAALAKSVAGPAACIALQDKLPEPAPHPRPGSSDRARHRDTLKISTHRVALPVLRPRPPAANCHRPCAPPGQLMTFDDAIGIAGTGSPCTAADAVSDQPRQHQLRSEAQPTRTGLHRRRAVLIRAEQGPVTPAMQGASPMAMRRVVSSTNQPTLADGTAALRAPRHRRAPQMGQLVNWPSAVTRPTRRSSTAQRTLPGSAAD